MDGNSMRLIQQTDMSLPSPARARSQLKVALMQSGRRETVTIFQLRTARLNILKKHKQLL